ncbi:putative dehydrogenase [Serinibacter salmoneus]|uniref:Putative dehydrogenase n=2 Tax=Serinibacter salmoneus TaxID=556530 RepID=A0A2A9D121_9MICO|nr:putative dehydrogenase [Serinibacter salmoneus]
MIARDFMVGLESGTHGVLHAVGSSDRARAAAFAAEYGAPHAGTYEEVLDRADVDAVYVATVHTTHTDVATRALRAGKAVLCEKPMAVTAGGTESVLAVAAEEARPFVEAYKYRFTPMFRALRDVIGGGEIGQVTGFTGSFGFPAPSRTGRLFDPAVAGGAIWDVGCYPVSFAVGVAAAGGAPLGTARVSDVSAQLTLGVDATADATLTLGDYTARVRTAIVAERSTAVEITGTDGSILLPDGWGGRATSTTHAEIRTGTGVRTLEVPSVNPMGAEAEAVSLALAAGRLEAPEMPWRESRVITALLEDWHEQARAAGTEL